MTDTMVPTIISGSIVAACSIFITYLAKRISTAVSNLATKDFVTLSLVQHGQAMESKIGDMFVKSNFQNVVNADVELRVRRIEEAFGVKLAMRVKEPLDPGKPIS